MKTARLVADDGTTLRWEPVNAKRKGDDRGKLRGEYWVPYIGYGMCSVDGCRGYTRRRFCADHMPAAVS